MPTYDESRFDPPAPLAHVTLRNPDTRVIRSGVPMLMDTGADVTLIPTCAAQELDIVADSEKSYELMGFDGNTSFTPTVRLELIFLHRVFRGQFLLIDQEWGILGRNVLNAMLLLFDGPSLRWDEHTTAKGRS